MFFEHPSNLFSNNFKEKKNESIKKNFFFEVKQKFLRIDENT
jgi:hypothetical protein